MQNRITGQFLIGHPEYPKMAFHCGWRSTEQGLRWGLLQSKWPHSVFRFQRNITITNHYKQPSSESEAINTSRSDQSKPTQRLEGRSFVFQARRPDSSSDDSCHQHTKGNKSHSVILFTLLNLGQDDAPEPHIHFSLCGMIGFHGERVEDSQLRSHPYHLQMPPSYPIIQEISRGHRPYPSPPVSPLSCPLCDSLMAPIATWDWDGARWGPQNLPEHSLGQRPPQDSKA